MQLPIVININALDVIYLVSKYYFFHYDNVSIII